VADETSGVRHSTRATAPVPLGDLSRGWIATSPSVRSAVERVLSSGIYVGGPEHNEFERQLAEFMAARHAVGVASGTDALVISLLAAGCGAGSEVVVAANAGGYASSAAAQAGSVVVYADIDSDTLLMTAKTIDRVATSVSRVVVVTHLYGTVADMPSIAALCAERDMVLIEDCAQAVDGSLGGRRVGTFGDVGVVSFYPTKNLGAAGDGGAVITNRDDIAERARSLRQYGWGDKYSVELPGGRNSRLDELQAAILRVGLGHVGELTAKRRQIVERYRLTLRDTKARLVTGLADGDVTHLAVVRVPDRDRVRGLLLEQGIMTGIHYPVPDHLQPALPPPSRVTSLVETARAAGEILSLPCFAEMTPAEIDRVCDALAMAVG
jgi:aminotransferase EvaB